MPRYLDFKAIAEAIDVEQVAAHLGLQLKRSAKELRCACPACGTDDERALAVMPETNSYRCYAAQISGDCISLYAHIKGSGMYKAAKELQELFGTPTGGRTVPATPPQKPEGRTAPVAQPAPKAFDPEAFAAKLIYNERVEELGISQDDAARLTIGYCSTGFHRDRVCFAIRNPDGTIAGYVGYRSGELKVPSQWITGNVVPLRKRPA